MAEGNALSKLNNMSGCMKIVAVLNCFKLSQSLKLSLKRFKDEIKVCEFNCILIC